QRSDPYPGAQFQVALPAPQLARGDVGALAAGLELGPYHVVGDQLVAGEGAEAAVARGDDPAAVADGIDRLADAVGDDLRMLDEVGRGVDHAGNQDELVRQLRLLERGV